MTEPVQPPAEAPVVTVTYKDDDLVYVDPELRTVVGRVEFLPNGKSKPLAMKNKVVEADADAAPSDDPKMKGKMRPRRERYYPWGTYRSMKRIYKIEGKPIREENRKTLDEVIEKALQEPFWD